MVLPKTKGSKAMIAKLIHCVSRTLGITACGLVLVMGASGCTFVHNAYENMRYDETWNRAVTSTRSKAWSKTAWQKRKHLFCRQRHLDSFCDGFRAGYQEVCSGTNLDGCTPSVPPREYWSWQYQSAEGQQQVAAWFAGYPQGARAAEEDGVANWNQIQLSSNLQQQYRTAGVLPASQANTYPITSGSVSAGPPINIGGPTAAPNVADGAQPVGISRSISSDHIDTPSPSDLISTP